MKRKIIPLVIGCGFSLSTLAAQPQHYIVTFPEGTRVSYSGAFASAFPNGLPVGIGSGLLFTGKQGDALTFETVTDRGPNADSPDMGKKEAKIFVTPDFAPLLMKIRVQNGKAEATDARPLHDEKGNVNGLPLQDGVIGSTNEVALSDTLKVLHGDNRGLDTEGITTDGKGGYWLCDEYGPFLINVDQRGRILSMHGPQAAEGEKSIAGGLPNVLKWRQPNRGFEGLTRMPDGRIIAAVQSTLDINGKSKKQARFTRLVSFDPATGKTAMYGYPIDSEAYAKNNDAKIGDIVAIDNQHILLIEQGSGKDDVMRNLIYKVDLSRATDLAAFDKPDEYPELDDEKTLAQRGIKLAAKTRVVDLRQLGWQQEKAEGLALIDNKTLAVANDNDFGVKMVMKNPVEGKKRKDYRVNEQGTLTVDDKPVATTIGLKPLEKPESDSELWIVTLAEPLK
ncbi:MULTISPECIES: esterase-like activity of phytase family protein [Pantoea]|uniref:Esterase-like activity of phytase family protein n=1 Tax=Pantoea brenneri TaxID=472694 RepID=A0A7Y6NIT6_9GAMM|nr:MULTISPECIES: esterase-like activity of phytase family protein [Pantoea]MBZ6397860.1 esterase-like activity of phytase family protein [Pantoea sp.]MBZ6441033.1 esterase-like activity of phytase family protein [Pantoea sp.]NUY44422.1 esterase-like activity of phytase family protein [Pantoea brenneri]NUY51932.1 esterase-like activity of phytase family protein [Pantoea brenneri]NUY62256.1 esterase-like activity of phytase family protein [Pantoea brenneri]